MKIPQMGVYLETDESAVRKKEKKNNFYKKPMIERLG